MTVPQNNINKYGNTQISAVFNFKDEVEEVKIEPTIGVDVLDKSTSFNVTTTTFYSYKTDEYVSIRKTKGIGGSITNFSSNMYYDKTKVDTSVNFITFDNNAPVPNQFVLPFSSTIIGFRYQTSILSSYNIHYTYKDLKPLKIKSSFYKYIAFEALFSPSVRNGETVYYEDANKVVQQLKIEDVKKSRLGFRLLYSSNVYNESKMKVRRKPGLFYNMELGMRPGIYPNRGASDKPDPSGFEKAIYKIGSMPWYMRFGIGISI